MQQENLGEWQVRKKCGKLVSGRGGETRTPMRATFRTLLLLPVLAAVLTPTAEAASSRPAVVLLFMKSAGALGEEVLRSLLVDSITLELSDRNMVVQQAAGFPRTIDEAVRLTRAAECDFSLVGTYALQERQVLLELQWIDAGEGTLAAQASRRGPLDLSFDAIVADAVREILAGQGPRLANLPPRAAKAEANPGRPPSRAAIEARIADLALPEPGPEKLPEVLPSGEPAAEGQAAAELLAASPPVEELPPKPVSENEPAVRTPGTPPSPLAKPVASKLAFSAGAAPFISTFAAAKYFAMGLSVSLSGQYRFNLRGGLVGVGLVAGAHAFQGKGDYAEADFVLIPLGPEISYGTFTGFPVDFSAHASGGPAVFVARLSGGNPLAKVVPYLTGGVSMTVSMGKVLGISIDGSYAAFFDSPTPILAYSPSLSILLRL